MCAYLVNELYYSDNISQFPTVVASLQVLKIDIDEVCWKFLFIFTLVATVN